MSVGVSGSPSVDLVGELDQQLRDVVRREGVDPQLETKRVRRLAEEVVRAHDERSLTGVVTPVPDPVGVRRAGGAGSPASVRCSASSTIRRSRGSGSMIRAACSWRATVGTS